MEIMVAKINDEYLSKYCEKCVVDKSGEDQGRVQTWVRVPFAPPNIALHLAPPNIALHLT